MHCNAAFFDNAQPDIARLLDTIQAGAFFVGETRGGWPDHAATGGF
jgi:hypothetical protein